MADTIKLVMNGCLQRAECKFPACGCTVGIDAREALITDDDVLRGACALIADDWTGENLYEPEMAMRIAKTVIYNGANDEDKDDAIRRARLVLEAVNAKP